jgi:hypothetical protein
MVVGSYPPPFEIGNGVSANLYLLRYGADGQLMSPQTEQMLKNDLAGVSDVFLCSHGWNNTFDDAAKNYRTFVNGYMQQRANNAIPLRPDYKPVIVGVIWPSTSFLMPWEKGPQIAADSPVTSARTEEMLRLVSESVDAVPAASFVELVDGTTRLTTASAREAAEIVLACLQTGVDPDDGSSPLTATELLDAWAALEGGGSEVADPDDFGGVGGGGAADPIAAGGLGFLDPRNLLRVGTLWLMKDRAGKVGAHGVEPLVRHILDESGARLHLIGHSFGARVLLSSLAFGQPQSRKARSMLLLQAAVNRWCFAADVAGTGVTGGYNPILTRVELPVLATFSKHDVPLTQAFQLAVRGSSLGEPDIAALGDTGRYGALGGYGPAGLGEKAEVQLAIAAGAGRYDLGRGGDVVAVDGGVELNGRPAIGGHGDVNNPTTWWALHCLTEER